MAEPSLPLDQVLTGDCIELLQTLPPASVDLIFADPPYNLQLRNDLWRPNLTKVEAVNDAWHQFADFAAYDAFTHTWLEGCRRVLKLNGALWVIGTYHNIHRVGAILQDLGYWILNDIIWLKTNPMPNFRGVRFTNAHETLIWAQPEKGARYTFNHQAARALNEDLQMRSDWNLPLCSGSERLKENGMKAHSTQKPEALLYRILLTTTNPGDTVLDPFFGTGTSGAVARRLRRHFIGLERDETYARLARERIANIQPAEEAAIKAALRPKPARLPFGNLLEAGLLQPGQTLFFGRAGTYTTRVNADGSLEYNGQRGSIHQIARMLQPGPINGWQAWFYENETMERRPIDELRQELRLQLKSLPKDTP